MQDNRRALVGTHSPFSNPLPGDWSPSVLIESLTEDAPASAVVDLLIWARRNFPTYAVSNRIKLHPHEFDADLRPVERPAPTLLDVLLPTLPEDYDHSTLPLWELSWREMHSVLRSAWEGMVKSWTTAEIVMDTEHSSLLSWAVEVAKRQLVVVDDHIHPAIADHALADRLRRCRASGAAVHLIRPPAERRGDGKHEAFEQLGSGPNSVQVRMVRDGGRLVVFDDEVVIGSYSALSEGGAKPRHLGDRRSHVGIRLRGLHLANEVARALRLPVPVDSVPEKAEPVAAVADESIALSLLFAAKRAGDGLEFGRTVVRELATRDAPWAVIDRWSNTKVPVEDTRRAVAALLLDGRHRDKAGADTWARWLVEDAWRRQAFVEAALLSRVLAPTDRGLVHAAVLAAAIEAGPIDRSTVDLALELDLRGAQEHRVAGAAGAMAEFLFWGDAEGEEALRVLDPSLPARWRVLAAHAVRYFQTARGPLPVQLIETEHLAQSRLGSLDRHREEIIDRTDRMERLRGRFTFQTGVELHKSLFAPDGLLTRIRNVARGGPDTAAAQEPGWLPHNVRGFVNDLIHRTNNEPMQWYRQQGYLRRLEELVLAMRLLLWDWDHVAEGGGGLTSSRPWGEFGRRLADEWDGLYAEAAEVEQPCGLPLFGLLDKLGPLAHWARENA